MNRKTYTVEEVAKVLVYHRGTVMDFLRRGKIKGLKLGTSWRVTEDEVRRVLSLGLRRNQHQATRGETQND